MCIDPLAEKYTYNSPYAFAENRVIDGRELEGLEWVDAKGNTIYNTNKDNGKVGYTSYATSENKNLGNALKSTKTGTEQFNKLVNMTHPVEIVVNKTDAPISKEGEPILGATITPKKDNPDGKSTITLFDKNINALVDGVAAGVEAGGTSVQPMSDGTDLSINGITKVGQVGVTLGEEVEHATPENISLQHSGASRATVEKKPNEVSEKILKETMKN